MVRPNVPHHVARRGMHRQDVFLVDGDRRPQLKPLAEQCENRGGHD